MTKPNGHWTLATRFFRLVVRQFSVVLLGLVIIVATPLTGNSSVDEDQRLETTSDMLQCVFSGNHRENDSVSSLRVLWFVRGTVIPISGGEWRYTLRHLGDPTSTDAELAWIEGDKLLERPEAVKANICSELLPQVKVRRLTVTAERCKAFRDAVSQFRELKLTAVPSASIRLGSSHYSIEAGTLEGDSFQWEVSGDPSHSDAAHPLVKWSEELRRAIMSCAQQ